MGGSDHNLAGKKLQSDHTKHGDTDHTGEEIGRTITSRETQTGPSLIPILGRYSEVGRSRYTTRASTRGSTGSTGPKGGHSRSEQSVQSRQTSLSNTDQQGTERRSILKSTPNTKPIQTSITHHAPTGKNPRRPLAAFERDPTRMQTRSVQTKGQLKVEARLSPNEEASEDMEDETLLQLTIADENLPDIDLLMGDVIRAA